MGGQVITVLDKSKKERKSVSERFFSEKLKKHKIRFGKLKKFWERESDQS